jgi:hypothetical protein
MAFMTENTNLQSALLRRIEEVGKGRVEIREMERGRVGEMVLGEGERWVGLKVGEEWVRGSVVVSSWFTTGCSIYSFSRLAPMDPTRQSASLRRSIRMVTPTPPMR